MKTQSLLILLFFCCQGFSQVSVDPRHVAKPKKFEKGTFEKFKNTETIFVLSNIYDKATYEKILKASWTVTPFRIVNIKDFNIEDYLNDNYSIAQLSAHKRIIKSEGSYSTAQLYTYIDFKLYNNEVIFEKINKLSPVEKAKKKEKIINNHEIRVARFNLFRKDDFINSKYQNMETIIASMYSKDFFFNYKPGFLKNYFQKVNNLIEKEEQYWMFEDDYLLELKELSRNKLYIPSYTAIKHNGWTAPYRETDYEKIKELAVFNP